MRVQRLPDLSVDSEMVWQKRGSCRDVDATVFFPPATFEPKAARERREHEAKRVCATCEVKAECLQWALETEEPWGVWGGATENERKRMLLVERQAG